MRWWRTFPQITVFQPIFFRKINEFLKSYVAKLLKWLCNGNQSNNDQKKEGMPPLRMRMGKINRYFVIEMNLSSTNGACNQLTLFDIFDEMAKKKQKTNHFIDQSNRISNKLNTFFAQIVGWDEYCSHDKIWNQTNLFHSCDAEWFKMISSKMSHWNMLHVCIHCIIVILYDGFPVSRPSICLVDNFSEIKSKQQSMFIYC